MAVDKSLVALRNNTEPGFLNVTDADGISQAQDNASKIEIVRAIDANSTSVGLADTRPLSFDVTDFNTTNTIDASVAQRLDIVLTADAEVNTINNLTRPVLIVVTGGFKLDFPQTNIFNDGTTNYNNPIIRLSRAEDTGFGQRIIAEYLNSPARRTLEVMLTGTSIDMGEQHNNILTRTGSGAENISITNPMLNGFVTIRHTGATNLTVNGQTLGGQSYNGSGTNVVDIRCVEDDQGGATPIYSVLNEVFT